MSSENDVRYSILEFTEDECKKLITILKDLDPQVHMRVNHIMATKGLKINEALEFVVTSSIVLWAKVYLNWTARDYQIPILNEMKRSLRVVLRLGRRLGKCLTGDSLIPDPVTGKYKRIDELYKKQKANVWSFDTESYKTVSTSTSIITDNGIKDVYKLVTQSGREIKATGNHPFWTIDGYKELDDLNPNDYVAISSCNVPSKPMYIDENIIKLIAYMLGNGTCTLKTNIRFSINSENTKVINEMKSICTSFKCDMFQYDSDKKADYHIKGISKGFGKRTNNNIADILAKYDIIGKHSYDKTIPDEIFRLSNKQLAVFISRLYATDGWATGSYKDKGRVEIGYSSTSKQMLVQLQSLLLRFGINSKLSEKRTKLNGKVFISYVLGIYSRTDCKLFIDKIGIYSKEDAINNIGDIISVSVKKGRFYPSSIKDKLANAMREKNISPTHIRNTSGIRFDSKYSSICEEKIRKANDIVQCEEVQNIIDSNVIWDKIVSIKHIGKEQTYDFTVPDYHNFVVNDFITHNTDCMCVAILWFAYTQYNRRQDDQYNIVIATPFDNQINLIFTRLKQLYKPSHLMQACVTRDIHHRLEFTINGVTSIIEGFTSGSNNRNNGAAGTRGQRADVIIFDEIDYMEDNQISTIEQLTNEAPDTIKILAASTPTGKHNTYYRWCTNARKRYSPSKKDIENNEFHGYEVHTRDGKDTEPFVEIYAPSNVNKEVLKIDPETGETYLQGFKNRYTEMVFAQEVMAEFGEESLGVYQKKYIQIAVDEGRRIGHKYITEWDPQHRKKYLEITQGQNIRCLGVDWDKYGASTHLVCVEYDVFHTLADGKNMPAFKIMFHVEIPRSEFTYAHAMEKIIELDQEYKFDWIAIDRGYGESQWEILKIYGMEHPESGMLEKLKAYQFGQNIEIIDPYTRKKRSEPVKPYMVNNSVNLFEKQKMVLNPDDKYIIQQLEEYRVESISNLGKPIYCSENEHAVDAINLALLIFAENNDALLRKIYSSKILPLLHPIDKRTFDVDEREPSEEEDIRMKMVIPVRPVSNGRSEGVVSLIPKHKNRYRVPKEFTRELW